MTSQNRWRDAFTGTHALSKEVRSALATVLGCAPDEVADAPLGDITDRRYRRHLVAAVVASTESGDALTTLAGVPLADLCPAATGIADDAVDDNRCPAGLIAPLRQRDSLRWSALLALRLADVQLWNGVGQRGAADLLGLALERSLAGLAEPQNRWTDSSEADEIAALVDYEGHGEGTLHHVLTGLAGGAHPDVVRQSARRLLQSCQRPASARAGIATARAEVLDELVESAGSARDQTIFRARELGVDGAPSSVQLCRMLKLSPERVRQLRIRAADRVLTAAADAPEWVWQLVTELRFRVGVAAPADDVTSALAELTDDLPTVTGGPLLSWLAGPYRAIRTCPGWLAIDPDRLVAMTNRALREDGGVRLADELSSELAGAGVVAAHRPGWLQACGAVFFDGMVASTAGACGDVLERVLFAAGRPLTRAELSSLPIGHTDEALAVVLRRDRRFVPVDGDVESDAVELAEWRPAPATATATRATARIDGTTRERVRPASPGPASSDGRLWMRVTVDAALLAGTPHPAPSHLPAELGLSPGQRRTFASRFGPVSILAHTDDPTIETLRPVALASGAGHGDALALGFDPDGAVTVNLLGGDPISAGSPRRAEGAR